MLGGQPRPLAARLFIVLTVLLSIAPAQSARAQDCAGDCDHDGAVGITELVAAVNAALAGAAPDDCAASDGNGDGYVTIDEIVRAVDASVAGCPPEVLRRLTSTSRAAMTTAGSFSVLSFGSLGAGRGAAALRSGGGAGEAIMCGSGPGTKRITCVVDDSDSIVGEEYTDCVEPDPESGDLVERDGVRVHTVRGRDVCGTLEIPDDAAVTVELTEFAETVRNAGGDLQSSTKASLVRVVEPGAQGCAGRDLGESLDGTIERSCVAGCMAGLEELEIVAEDLRLERISVEENRSGETICEPRATLTGEMTIANAITGERFEQTFFGLAVRSETILDATATRLDGSLAIDCLGQAKFTTKAPIVLKPDAKCPSDGSIDVSLGSDAGEGSTAPATILAMAGSSDGAGAGNVVDNDGFVQSAFRAKNGQAYQVLQNVDAGAERGAEELIVTTLVGTLASALGCIQTPGGARLEAAVASSEGGALPENAIAKSPLVAFAEEPCFDPDAERGDGRLCIGPDCVEEGCLCPSGADCSEFTIRLGTAITAPTDIPAAERIGSLAGVGLACSGLAGASTYRFGSLGPTTQSTPCGAEPVDGFALARGRSIVFAYDTPLTTQVVAGAGGFLVTRDSDLVSGCDADEIVGIAGPNLSTLPPPNFRFSGDGAVSFDVNNDDAVDRTVPSCDDEELLECVAGPIAPPTPGAGCPQESLPSLTSLSRTRSTAGRANAVGGASCGAGGNAAPDLSFGYKAPRAGFYVIDTRGSQFDTILYVRRATCAGTEAVCNDDREFGDASSEVGIALDEGEEIVVVVDGFGGKSGQFNLNISFQSATPPSPTPTPTLPADRPNLVITEVEAPESGRIGGQIFVEATVANEGRGDSGAVQVEFAFSTDAVISDADTLSGFGCVFPGLNADGSATCAGAIAIPASLPPGRYFVGAIADLPDQVVETDEQDNGGAADAETFLSNVDPLTRTPTPSVTATPIFTASRTTTRTSTATPTPSPAPSRSATPTATPTHTAEPTPSVTSTATEEIPTSTPSATESPTLVPSFTASVTRTVTETRTVSPTRTPTPTRTATRTGGPGGTSVSGSICGNRVWSLAGSPYTVTGSILVGGSPCQGAETVLSIDAGVVVRFQPARGMRIENATLLALGTEGAEITFTSNQPVPARGDWSGIQFSSAAKEAVFDTNGAYISGSLLRHVVIEWATGPSGAAVAVDQAPPFFDSVTVQQSGGGGIYVTGLDSLVRIVDTVAQMNGGYGASLGGTARIQVVDSRFVDNGSVGLSVSCGCEVEVLRVTGARNQSTGIEVYGQEGTITQVLAEDNNFFGLRVGSSRSVVTDSTMRGNASTGLYQESLYCQDLYSGNLVVANGTGARVRCGTFERNCVSDNDPTTEFPVGLHGIVGTASYPTLIRFNTFVDNGAYVPVAITFEQNNLINADRSLTMESSQASGTLVVPNNWWGDEVPIEDQIHDFSDNFSLAIVDSSNPAEGAVAGAPDIGNCREGILTPTSP